jgi:hypothetical protein
MAKKIYVKKEEMETILLYNRLDDTAELYTTDSVVKTKFNKLCKEHPESYKLIKQDEVSRTYQFPKALISYRSKRIKRELSAEERKAIGQRLKNSAQ